MRGSEGLIRRDNAAYKEQYYKEIRRKVYRKIVFEIRCRCQNKDYCKMGKKAERERYEECSLFYS